MTLPPTPSPAAYEFGANFGDEHVLFASRLDMQGRMNGRINAQLGDSVLLRLQAQLQPDQPTPTSWKADVDYKGGSFCVGGSYIGGGLLQGHYLQSVTESLALGAEGLYHVHRPITAPSGGTIAFAGPTTCYPFGMDMGSERVLNIVHEPPAFAVHAWLPDATPDGAGLITHVLPVGDWDAPITLLRNGENVLGH